MKVGTHEKSYRTFVGDATYVSVPGLIDPRVIKGTHEKMGLGDSGKRNLFSSLSKNFSNGLPQNQRILFFIRIILFGWYKALKIIYKKFS